VDDLEPSGGSGAWARSFGANAEGYNQYRQPLSPRVLQWLGLEPGLVAVDVGAGTGQASRTMSAMGAVVIAVEPDPALREVLRSTARDIDVRDGEAEALPVDTGSVDLVIAVSAWHWFDQETAFREAERVLRPGGILGLVWNGVDQSDPWGRRFMAATETSDNSVVPPQARPGPHLLEAPATLLLEDVSTTTITWTWVRTLEQVLGLIRTYSIHIAGSPEIQRQITDGAVKLLREIESGEGNFTLPMAARCWRALKSDG
jgi:SAM-dependent methyltransferase